MGVFGPLDVFEDEPLTILLLADGPEHEGPLQEYLAAELDRLPPELTVRRLTGPEAAHVADLARAVDAGLVVVPAAGRLLQVGHIERFNPAFRELVKVVAGEEVLLPVAPVAPRVAFP